MTVRQKLHGSPLKVYLVLVGYLEQNEITKKQELCQMVTKM